MNDADGRSSKKNKSIKSSKKNEQEDFISKLVAPVQAKSKNELISIANQKKMIKSQKNLNNESEVE
eukprot:CAMPEP_0116871092 /NCGR_PEP_ID=MMETSP0463-20121206/1306_1 /TAXON_ID=181622 /ORGANISM="Strombidinopsis sp, Strain SopsisLIS2011" /LENGTH=65 /DNA_ID=CAMNT_0004508895 /DNA_START=1501 /DNA_END=1698 /DNA_ORIENTATION=-